MIKTEHQGISGVLTTVVYASDGRVVARRVTPNLITLTGKRLLAQLLTGGVEGKLELTMGVGSGTRQPAVSDTALDELVSEVPAALDRIEDVDGAVCIRVRASLPASKSKQAVELHEAGIFIRIATPKGGDSQAPTLFNRVLFDVLSWSSSTSMLLAWDITL